MNQNPVAGVYSGMTQNEAVAILRNEWTFDICPMCLNIKAFGFGLCVVCTRVWEYVRQETLAKAAHNDAKHQADKHSS